MIRLSKNSSISIKDIIIPIASAIFAVFLNQIFFESNRRTEAQIEYEKEIMRTQTPALNRILAFTFKYEIATITYITVPVEEISYRDRESGKIIKKIMKEFKEKSDSVSLTVHSFVIMERKRKNLYDDLEMLKINRDILDPKIYIAVENIIEFLNENKLPDIKNDEEKMKTPWKSEEVKNKWNKLIFDLRNVCLNQIENFKRGS